MTSQEQSRPLPKFGEWDVNDPASADGFTVIFAKARDEKNGTSTSANSAPPASPRTEAASPQNDSYHQDPMKKWFCCF
ncbi:protein NOI4-like isoform X2 [Lycium barbarum]|uniref:protein NOI4-like isoform X2 n=1 Tax=Lycium barbarum TaxID=112863 RepID=UPI00293E604C|nr:protein NOI4-like isoform X2 [Lycium barbarum]